MSSTVPRAVPAWHLHHRGARGRPGDAQQYRARLVRGSRRGVPLLAEQAEDGKLRERLRVGQQRGTPAHPAVAGPALAARGQGRMAVDRVDQRTALPGHEPVRHLDDPGPAPQVRFRPHRRGERAGQRAVGHPDDDLPAAQGLAGEQGTGQDQVRRPGQQHRVLDAAGLALAPVHQDDRLAAAGGHRRGDRPELVAERERRATAAAQVDAFGEVDELGRLHPPQRAEDLLVLAQADAREPVQPGGQPGLADPHDLGRGTAHRPPSPGQGAGAGSSWPGQPESG